MDRTAMTQLRMALRCAAPVTMTIYCAGPRTAALGLPLQRLGRAVIQPEVIAIDEQVAATGVAERSTK